MVGLTNLMLTFIHLTSALKLGQCQRGDECGCFLLKKISLSCLILSEFACKSSGKLNLSGALDLLTQRWMTLSLIKNANLILQWELL